MKDWIDSPVSNMRQRAEHDYWCLKCKEWYTVILQFENEVGEYGGDEACPFCGKDGIPREDMSE